METRELYWLHIVLQSQQTALEPEDTCRQAASTRHMHPRSRVTAHGCALVSSDRVRPPCSHAWSRNVEAAAPRLQEPGERPEHLPEQVSVDQHNVIVFEGYFPSPPNL